MRLTNKVALVTGAGSGFGEGIAKRFAAEGACVLVNDIAVEAGRRVTEEIQASGGKASFAAGDVARGDDVAGLLAAALDAFGALDIVVNNAGISHR
ncbi:MAG: SDR family NAD(P)-dependent oxidoreductase, partial [Burkholderiales bacterium]